MTPALLILVALLVSAGGLIYLTARGLRDRAHSTEAAVVPNRDRSFDDHAQTSEDSTASTKHRPSNIAFGIGLLVFGGLMIFGIVYSALENIENWLFGAMFYVILAAAFIGGGMQVIKSGWKRKT